MKYHKVQDGEVVQPKMRGYRMKCCDCGLVHRMNFWVVLNARRTAVQFQAFRVAPRKRRTKPRRQSPRGAK